MTISLADFIEGIATKPKIGFLKSAAVLAPDVSANLQALRDQGYTHYTREPAGILANQDFFVFSRIPPLETRLREHVEAFFPQ
jgi:hypothetical protein